LEKKKEEIWDGPQGGTGRTYSSGADARFFEASVIQVQTMQETILHSIGKTPLVRLRRVTEGCRPAFYVKDEAQNPGGSIKDRVAQAMIGEAERRGLLRPGGPSSRATAAIPASAWRCCAAGQGYRCIFVLPDKMSSREDQSFKAYGAEVFITPTNVPPMRRRATTAWPSGCRARSPGVRPTSSPTWPTRKVHYRSTGYEIWEQTEARSPLRGRRRHGRHHLGCGALSEGAEPGHPRYWGGPEDRCFPAGRPSRGKVEGIGEDFVPKTFNSSSSMNGSASRCGSVSHGRQMARREVFWRAGERTTVRRRFATPGGCRRITGCGHRRGYGPKLSQQVLQRRLAGGEQADDGRGNRPFGGRFAEAKGHRQL